MELQDCHPPDDSDNAFKRAFKYYKQKASTPSMDKVVDLPNEGSGVNKALVTRYTKTHTNAASSAPQNITSNKQWNVYTINPAPGLYLITNAFSKSHERYWCQTCVEQYSRSPCRTNLDPFKSKEEIDKSWEDSKRMIGECTDSIDLKVLKRTPIWKLRWSTLGYHHNWNSKMYSEKNKSKFPDELSEICKYVLASLGFSSYRPEAAIVNYYHAGDRLSPHVDTSEADLRLPLLSISFGLPAIFLIGDETRHTEPTAILLRSGSVLVMTGKSRTAYHAVPRVMPSDVSTDACDAFSAYMSNSRLNINVRQVESEQFKLLT